MKLVKAAGAIVLGLCMCNAGGVSASAVDMIQEEVQGASEGRVIDWDAEVVKATGKLEGKRGQLPAGRALKSPKSPKSCKASKSSKSFPGQWNAADEEVYEALVDATAVVFIGGSAVIDLRFDLNWFGTIIKHVCLYSNGWISISEICGDPGLGRIDFVSADLDPPIGSGKYLVKSSNSSLKISFEDVKFAGGVGNIQAQVELFETGDVLICYGFGDNPGREEFNAVVEDFLNSPYNYLITDDPFDDTGFTGDWPECQCWKFKMPLSPS